jgi:hypothetical protein
MVEGVKHSDLFEVDIADPQTELDAARRQFYTLYPYDPIVVAYRMLSKEEQAAQ